MFKFRARLSFVVVILALILSIGMCFAPYSVKAEANKRGNQVIGSAALQDKEHTLN